LLSTDTDPIPICFKSGRGAPRSVTDRSKAPDAAAATNNSGGAASAADAFDLWWTVKHSNYQ